MKKRHRRARPRTLRRMFVTFLLGAVLIAVWGWTAGRRVEPATADASVRAEAARFLSYYHSIHLTSEQEDVKTRALSPLPAPCCSNYSMATCCCACNLSKTVWGLSKHLIADEGYGVEETRAAVESWIQLLNPAGYSGRACFERRCNLAFHEDGCGGMREEDLS